MQKVWCCYQSIVLSGGDGLYVVLQAQISPCPVLAFGRNRTYCPPIKLTICQWYICLGKVKACTALAYVGCGVVISEHRANTDSQAQNLSTLHDVVIASYCVAFQKIEAGYLIYGWSQTMICSPRSDSLFSLPNQSIILHHDNRQVPRNIYWLQNCRTSL